MSKAEKLSPASSETLSEFRSKSGAIVAAVASRTKDAEPSFSEEQQETLVERMKQAQKTVESFLLVPSTALILEHMAWLADRVPREGVPIPSFIEGLRVHRDAIAEVLSAAAAQEILPLFDFMIEEIQRTAEQGGGE
jgi:hypothetical protein